MDLEGGGPREARSDRRLAVSLLGLIAVLAVVADAALLMRGHNPPGGLLALAGGCIGALATLVTTIPQVPRDPH